MVFIYLKDLAIILKKCQNKFIKEINLFYKRIFHSKLKIKVKIIYRI